MARLRTSISWRPPGCRFSMGRTCRRSHWSVIRGCTGFREPCATARPRLPVVPVRDRSVREAAGASFTAIGHVPVGRYGGGMADRVSVTPRSPRLPRQVWAMVADLARMQEWSPENDAATWRKGATGAAPGASFTGTNSAGDQEVVTRGTIVEATPGRVLSFRITALGVESGPVVLRIESDRRRMRGDRDVGRRARRADHVSLGRLVTGVSDRASHNRAGMEADPPPI